MLCLKEHDSLVIDPENNKWHWNSRNVHGTNAVDFLMAYDNRTFLDAISELLGRPPNTILPTAAEKISEPKTFTLPPRIPDMYRLRRSYFAMPFFRMDENNPSHFVYFML